MALINHPAFRRPSRYISGGIYAHAYIGVPSTLTPSAPHSWDAATPVTVYLRIASLACNTRHYRPPTSKVHPNTAPLLRDTTLATGYFVNKQIFATKGANIHSPSRPPPGSGTTPTGKIKTAPPLAPLLSPSATRSRRQRPPRQQIPF